MLKKISLLKLVIVLFLVFYTGNVFSQINDEESPWFFIQITDPQFGMFEKNLGFEKETLLFEKGVIKINQLQPDFLVVTGDFVHDQNSEAQINEFKRLVSVIKSEIPVYLIPGNHDVGMIPDEQSLKEYRKNYGADRFSFIHKGSSFVGFNTSLIKGKLESAEEKQYKWIKKQIEKGKSNEHIILFCHYPFFIKNVDEPTAYANIDLEYRKKYLDLFEANNVDVVFSGHHHNNNLKTYGSMQLVTTSALGKPLGEAPSGMRIIKIYNNKVEHNYYGLEEIPESIRF
jgi:3',5'-cyclic AMP phosphodiesterase CpdA